MAIKLYEIDSVRWEGKLDDYPQGKFIDNTNDTTLDGSYCSSLWANDIFGFHGAILKAGAVEPNGVTDTASASQVFNALKTVIRQDIESFGGIPSAVASGTSDVITADFTEEVTLTNGMYIQVRAILENTTATPTFNANNLGAKTIVKGNNQELAPGDIAGEGFWLHITFDASLDKWVLNNPATGVELILPEGSVTQKGIVQLSETINEDNTKAITPAAVKAQFDKGKVLVVSSSDSTSDNNTLYLEEVAGDEGELFPDLWLPLTQSGDVNTLKTSNKIVVDAVNEVKAIADNNKSSIGTLTNLATSKKDNLVNAINEIKGGNINVYVVEKESDISLSKNGFYIIKNP